MTGERDECRQPYGFTSADVEVLLQLTDWIAAMEEDEYDAEQCKALISIADRMTALLPPEVHDVE